MAQPRFLGVLLSLCACGQGQKSQPFAAESETFFDNVETAVTTPVSDQRIAEFRKVTILKFYDLLLKRTSDEPFMVQGQVARDVHSQLIAAESAFKKLDASYSSWGDFTAKRFDLTVAPGRHITRQVYSEMIRKFANRSGVFTPLQNAPKGINPVKNPEMQDSLNLVNSEQEKNNLVAIAAISLVMRHTQGQGLGLAEPEVTNGLSGTACTSMTDISAVNRISHEVNGVNKSMCTGTFYKSDKVFDYLLTAAHCTDSVDGNWTTQGPTGVTAKGIVVRNAPGNQPPPPQVASPKMQSNDLSVIVFPVGTAKGYMKQAAASPKPGTPVKVAGYGKTTQNINIPNAFGTMNCGSNDVAQTVEQQGVITLFGVPSPTSPTAPLGTKSLISSGDSGGPLIRIGEDGKPEIVGVAATATIYVGSQPPSQANATYVDINSVWAKNYIKQRSNLKTEDIPVCTNGSNNGNGTGTQPGIGGVDNKTCRVPDPEQGSSNGQTPRQPAGRQDTES